VIRQLDPTTIGLIAAGEVIERPVSVLKELVENALDAGATRIAVDVRRGGLDLIDVSDDGAGIAASELALAFARHATSKLVAASDLERVVTLGFRGEGLASIAAVAHVRLTSRTPGAEFGFTVTAHGLAVSTPEPVAAPGGTRVRVEALFENVPARRAYLRSATAEYGRIATFLATLALAYPRVAFSLAHDGRPAFAFAPGDALDQRLAHVFGVAARALTELEATASEAATVRGFVSRPGSDRGDRRLQLLFVNDRLVRSNAFAGAWSAGYATYALAHRHPFGVLFVDVPSDRVDPNVHPTKAEVRLRDPEATNGLVRRAIARTLGRDATERMRDALSFSPALPAVPVVASTTPAAAPALRLVGAEAGVVAEPAPEFTEAPRALRVLAQLDATFVLATDGRALVLVDQHAAHERVAYEAIAARARLGGAPTEPLLVPYTIELEPRDAERFAATLDALAAAGCEVEPFGERCFRVLATPAGYGARAFDLRGYVADLGDDVPGLGARERIWASLACHSVTRAGEALEAGEMEALLARLVTCENPMHCPHGRPTIVRLEADAIARMFKR